MSRITIIVAVLLLSLPRSAVADSPTEDPNVAEITATILAGVEGWNRGDIEGFMGQYWQSADLRFASGGTVSFGWQTVLDRYKKRYPDRKTMGHLVFSDLDVRLLGDEAALAFGRWTLEREGDAPTGLFTLVLKRLPEGWRIVHDHTSSGEE
mgnify:CR=1 FL=1